MSWMVVNNGTGGGESEQFHKQVTLAAASWSSNRQSVTVSGVTANSVIYYQPAYDSGSDFDSCGIEGVAQSTNTITFQCSEVPTSAIIVDILFSEPTEV